MNRREITDHYAPCNRTQFPDALIGWNGGLEWVHLFKDSSGDWDRSGMPFPSRLEALATLPAAHSRFHGANVELPVPANVALLGRVVATLHYLDGHLQLSVTGLADGEQIGVEVNGRRYQP